MKLFKLLVFIIICFAPLIMTACNSSNDNMAVVSIQSANLNYTINDEQTSMDNIEFIYENGSTQAASYADFWYISQNSYIYVQNGYLKTSETAPAVFSDTLQIIYKKDASITADIQVTKEYVPLESIELVNEHDKYVCLPNNEIVLDVVFTPTNASYKQVQYDIVSGGEYATIDESGRLLLGADAPIGYVITVSATGENDISTTVDVTVYDRIEIGSLQQLLGIKYHPELDYEIVSDIDMSTLTNWVPIPNFYGSIWGNDYTLSNLNITIPAKLYEEDTPFGFIANNYGTIAHLSLEDVTITGYVYHGGSYTQVGSLAGYNSGDISYINITGGYIKCQRYMSRTGGVVGVNNYGTVYNCNVDDVTFETNGDIGAISGTSFHGDINNNSASNIDMIIYIAYRSRSIGGIVGYTTTSAIENNSVNGIDFTVTGYGHMSGYSVSPKIGFVVGNIVDSDLIGFTIQNCTIDTGNLTTNYTLSDMFQGTNQLEYVTQGIDHVYGKALRTIIIH
ncbi:MAG: hypothetical protein AB7S44_02890 [Spirochaetales bacterium]